MGFPLWNIIRFYLGFTIQYNLRIKKTGAGPRGKRKGLSPQLVSNVFLLILTIPPSIILFAPVRNISRPPLDKVYCNCMLTIQRNLIWKVKKGFSEFPLIWEISTTLTQKYNGIMLHYAEKVSVAGCKTYVHTMDHA